MSSVETGEGKLPKNTREDTALGAKRPRAKPGKGVELCETFKTGSNLELLVVQGPRLAEDVQVNLGNPMKKEF